MAKSSIKEKLVLTFLVTNCEMYRLNEQEALQYIRFHFPKPISRRTYYHYKKSVYEICLSPYAQHEDGDNGKNFQFLKPSEMTDFITHGQLRLLLPGVKDSLVKEGLEMDVYLDGFGKLIFFPTHFIDSLDHTESVINRSKYFLDQIKQESHPNNANRRSLPHNATIRREYVKCGKEFCNGCKHGPYYYGYWREKNGKLKKKYIGIDN